MGWFQRSIRGLVKRAAKYANIPLRDPALIAMLGNTPTESGVDVDEHVALNYSAVWAAINVIASQVAALPAVPYEVAERGHRQAKEHPAWHLLMVAPNREMSPYTFHETLTGHALSWGNGYAELDKASPEDGATTAVPLMPNQVQPDRDDKTGEIYYRFTALYPGEHDQELPWWKVLHVPGFGFDGLQGYPVVDMARESIGLGLAAERYGGGFFGRGCTLGGMLEAPPEVELTEKAKKNLRESFELLHRGTHNSFRIGILEQGWKYTPVGVPPETAQFLETRQFQIVEVARWFNLPPHLLRDLTHATYSNIEQQGIDFFQITLRPWLIRWNQEYRRKLFGLPDQERYFVRHDAHNLKMMDANSRFDVYGKGRNMGVYTLNDILIQEGMNPLDPEIGDVRLAPSTMKVLSKNAEPMNPDLVKKAMDLLSSMSPIHPHAAKALLVAMVPGIEGEALEALVRRLPDYKPGGGGTPPALSQRKKDDNGDEHGSDGKFTSEGGGGGKGDKKDPKAAKLKSEVESLEKTAKGKEQVATGEKAASSIKTALSEGVKKLLDGLDDESKGGISLIAGGLKGKDATAVAAGAAQLLGSVFQCVHQEVYENALSQHSIPGAHLAGKIAASVAAKAETGVLKAIAWAWHKSTGRSMRDSCRFERRELTGEDKKLLDGLTDLAVQALRDAYLAAGVTLKDDDIDRTSVKADILAHIQGAKDDE